jgi:hypothetical protein
MVQAMGVPLKTKNEECAGKTPMVFFCVYFKKLNGYDCLLYQKQKYIKGFYPQTSFCPVAHFCLPSVLGILLQDLIAERIWQLPVSAAGSFSRFDFTLKLDLTD